MSIIQGPFSVAPCQTLISRFATFSSPKRTGGEASGASIARGGGLEPGSASQNSVGFQLNIKKRTRGFNRLLKTQQACPRTGVVAAAAREAAILMWERRCGA